GWFRVLRHREVVDQPDQWPAPPQKLPTRATAAVSAGQRPAHSIGQEPGRAVGKRSGKGPEVPLPEIDLAPEPIGQEFGQGPIASVVATAGQPGDTRSRRIPALVPTVAT